IGRCGRARTVISFCCRSRARRFLPPFPTRRSSDLDANHPSLETARCPVVPTAAQCDGALADACSKLGSGDGPRGRPVDAAFVERSEEHTSELQSRENLVCRLLREKKRK